MLQNFFGCLVAILCVAFCTLWLRDAAGGKFEGIAGRRVSIPTPTPEPTREETDSMEPLRLAGTVAGIRHDGLIVQCDPPVGGQVFLAGHPDCDALGLHDRVAVAAIREGNYRYRDGAQEVHILRKFNYYAPVERISRR